MSKLGDHGPNVEMASLSGTTITFGNCLLMQNNRVLARRAENQWRMDGQVRRSQLSSSIMDSLLQVPAQVFTSLDQVILSRYYELVYSVRYSKKDWVALINDYTPFQWKESFDNDLHCLLQIQLLRRSSHGRYELQVELYVRNNKEEWKRIHVQDVRASNIEETLMVRV